VTRTELRRGSDVKERILDAILSSRVQSRTLPSRQQIKTFLSEYFAHVPYEDLQGRDEKIMARAAISHLDFGAVRRKGQPLIRFFNPTLEERITATNPRSRLSRWSTTTCRSSWIRCSRRSTGRG
jgi:hypothetical protein